MSLDFPNKTADAGEAFTGMLGIHPPEPAATSKLALSEGLYPCHLKRVLDIFLSIPLIVISLPIMAVIWLLLMLQSGPAIFAHSRVGRQGKEFSCLKFRTMRPDADLALQALLVSDPVARKQWDENRKLDHDPRITRLGQFLRRSSLDELPQLFNVLRGEMSLIGPRPVTSSELDRYGNDRAYYLALSPGMTGLWQVSGRNLVSYGQRVALDRHYAETLSLRSDLSILLRTVNVVLRGSGK